MTDPVPSGIAPGADLSLGAVLGFEPAAPGDDASRERGEGVVKWLREVAREFPALHLVDVAPGMALAIARVLQTSMSTIGINLWNKRREIQKYADVNQYPATEMHAVEFYEHDIEQKVKPKIDIRLNGLHAASVTLSLKATVTLKAVKLVIRGGYITHLRLGELIGKATLGVAEPARLSKLKLMEVKPQSWKLDRDLPLPGKGIQIGS